MGKRLRNPKYERFVCAIVIEGKDPALAYVDGWFWKAPRIKSRMDELRQNRELAARAARAPVSDVLIEPEEHDVERVADFYQDGSAGGWVASDLRAVKAEIALALLNSLHDAFGIAWEQATR